MEHNGVFRRRNRALLVAYIIVLIACLLPAFGIAFNSNSLVIGIPISVAWLTICFSTLAIITALAYRFVFSLWHEDIDTQESQPASKGGGQSNDNRYYCYRTYISWINVGLGNHRPIRQQHISLPQRRESLMLRIQHLVQYLSRQSLSHRLSMCKQLYQRQ